MANKHVVQAGESPSQIAARFGFVDWKTIYQHADNAELRKKRSDPSAIFPGDVVAIPPVEPRVFKLETGKRHKIVIPRPRQKLIVVVKDREGEPLAGKKFELRVAGQDKPIEGSTTGDGSVECDLPGAAREAQLVIWVAGDKTGTRYVWNLELAGLFAPETENGVRQRLNNLGYYAGEADNDGSDEDDGDDDGNTSDNADATDSDGGDSADDGDATDPLSLALAAFQEDMGLDATGEIDEATRAKLVEVHGGT